MVIDDNNKEKELIIKNIYKRIKKYNIVLCGTQTFKSRINEIQVLRRMEKFYNFMNLFSKYEYLYLSEGGTLAISIILVRIVIIGMVLMKLFI